MLPKNSLWMICAIFLGFSVFANSTQTLPGAEFENVQKTLKQINKDLLKKTSLSLEEEQDAVQMAATAFQIYQATRREDLFRSYLEYLIRLKRITQFGTPTCLKYLLALKNQNSVLFQTTLKPMLSKKEYSKLEGDLKERARLEIDGQG